MIDRKLPSMFTSIILLLVILVACLYSTEESPPRLKSTPSLAESSTYVPTTDPTAISKTKPSVEPIQNHFHFNDPRIVDLEQKGFALSNLSDFEITASTETMQFGKPGDTPLGMALVTRLDNGLDLLYMQYESQEFNNCFLVFGTSKDNEIEVISIVDPITINDRLGLIMSLPSEDYGSPVYCTSYDWQDVNQNGLPDIPVSFLWGNRLAGSQLHIFEVSEDLSVINLTKDLPGFLSPWDFAPARVEQVVWDFSWANHDCFYPPFYIFRVFNWKGNEYIDSTHESEIASEYLTSQTDLVTSNYGQPLYASSLMKPIVQILLMYDRIGERERGWKLFLEMTNPENWPNSSPTDLEWLESDVAHFMAQYHAKEEFSPNDFCPYQ